MAITLAVLYFGLVELMLLDSSRELAAARRFRARIVAHTLAENGAELAARDIAGRASASVNAEDWQGTITGRMTKNPAGHFDIEATGRTSGIVQTESKVFVRGRIVGNDVRIQYTIHNP